MLDKINMTFPKYLKDFACTGSACDDTCCIGWRVDIDKATYLNYKNYRGENDELGKQFEDHVKRNRRKKSDTNYAAIKMGLDTVCPFLDEQRLCSIQCAMGMDALSSTCMCYPRKYYTINKINEMSATLSCPEIARLALLNPDGIEFIS